MKLKHELKRCSRQGGGVLVLFGIALAVLIGFLGIVLDLGRLFVTKTELQTAMDACALAAAAELRPGLNPPDLNAVDRAVSAGITAGTRNRVDLQAGPVAISATDIYFSDRLSDNTTTFPFGYVPAAAANPATARYVLCARAQTGIATWFMQVLEGFIGATSTPNTVSAWATATTAPAQTSCGIPIGICKKPGSTGPNWGFSAGEWVSGRFDAGGGLTGSFNWIDFSPPAGGASELAALLAGQGQCNLNVTSPVGQTGIVGNAAAKAWNSRFGLYQGGGGNPSLTTAPPDHSGYSYTPTNWPAQANAFPDFQQNRRNTFASYGDTVDTVDAGNAISGLSITNAYRVTTHGVGGEHDTGGADRRISTAPVVDCAEWVSSQTVPIIGWVCILMLHPISAPGDIVRMEFLGSATTLGSPCTTYGIAGGTAGPMVPVLVH
jgi:Flp pilus assembly protein TadG